MRVVTSSLIACLIASPLVAGAGGYDKATWGMTLEQVKTLYPQGMEDFVPGTSKGTNYTLITKDSTFPLLVGFDFPQGKLAQVSTLYGIAGGKGPVPVTREQAIALGVKVRGLLESRFGKPAWTPANGPKFKGETAPADMLAAWESPDTLVVLMLQSARSGSPADEVGVIAAYIPKPAKPPAAAVGGYEKTTWGMTVEQVKALYPDASSSSSGDYAEVMRLTNDSTLKVLVTFQFRAGKLTGVDVLYRDPGGKPTFVYAREQASALGVKVRGILESRFGKPWWTPADGPEINGRTAPPDSLAVWKLPDTLVMLKLQTMASKPNEENLTIVAGYRPTPAAPPSGK